MLLQCSTCRTQLTIPESLAGKSARCPKCQRVFIVPDASPLETTPFVDPIQGLLANDPAVVNPFGLDVPGGSVRDRVRTMVRRGRKRTWAFVGASLCGVVALLVLIAGILGAVHFQASILYLLGGTLVSSVLLGLTLFRLIHSGFFPASVWSSWKFHVAAAATILGVGIASGLVVYLSQLWSQHSTQIQIILGVSLLATVAGALVGWYLAWIVYES